MDYTSETEIRTKVLNAAEAKARASADTEGVFPAPEPGVVERFIEQRIATARKQGKLMTDRQLADYRHGRTLRVGDLARYVGPDRSEEVRVGGKTAHVTRPHGQEGTIIDATRQGDHVVVTFRPTVNAVLANETIVELTVKEGTAGYLDLERVT